MEVLISRSRHGIREHARIAAIGLTLLVAFVAWRNPAAAQDSAREYAVKAAYLAKFGSFVDWPKSAFASPTTPINICISGQDPFGAALERLLSGQQAGARPIVVRRIATGGRDPGCQILYAGGSDAQSVDQSLAAARGMPTLTVTDDAPAGSNPSVLYFVVRDNRVRFVIDDQAAATNGLTISSELLKLALSVKARN
jgi:hypothetical protein